MSYPSSASRLPPLGTFSLKGRRKNLDDYRRSVAQVTQIGGKLGRKNQLLSGAVMDDGTYLKPLACVCSNKGAAVWVVAGATRRLHDLDGDFHRDGRNDDAPIVCDVCGRAIPA